MSLHMALIEIAQKATSIMHCVLVAITERPSAGHDAAVVAAWLVLLHKELFPLLPRQISVVVESATRVRGAEQTLIYFPTRRSL